MRFRWAGFMFLFFFLSLTPVPMVKALGQADTDEEEAEKKEWTVVACSLDVSALSPSKKSIGTTVIRSLVSSLDVLVHRKRSGEELEQYQKRVWAEARTEAGKKVATKQAARDGLLFKGYPDWKYKAEYTKLDLELETAKQELAEISATSPAIHPLPIFIFTEDNRKGTYPAPPKKGGEYKFCKEQKADALITGSVRELYERVLVSIEVYHAVDRAVIYKDLSIFSPENRQAALDELSERLFNALSGEKAATLTITTVPQNAGITVNNMFEGVGKAGPLFLSPGQIHIGAFSPQHAQTELDLEVAEGEGFHVNIHLEPLAMEALTVQVPQGAASVYANGYFMGIDPLTVDLIKDDKTHILVETVEKAHAARVIEGQSGSLSLDLMPPDVEGEDPVELARKKFYGAYGRFWLALPVAFILNGISESYIKADEQEANPNLGQDMCRYFVLSRGVAVVSGVFLVESIYRFLSYVYTTDTRSTKEAKVKKGDS